jgi:hypothetical protein
VSGFVTGFAQAELAGPLSAALADKIRDSP